MFDETAFHLLKTVLSDAYRLRLCHFPDWEGDLSAFDNGLRRCLQNEAERYAAIRALLPGLAVGELLCLKDALLVSYVLFRGSAPRELYSIGPFRPHPYTAEEIAALRRGNRLTSGETEQLRGLLAEVPTDVQRGTALTVAQNVLGSLYRIVPTRTIEHALAAPLPALPKRDLTAEAARVEEIYRHEAALCAFVAEGNEQKAMREAHYFTQSVMDSELPTPMAQRSFLFAANTTLRKAAQGENIHPVYLHALSRRFAHRITLCASDRELTDVYFEMVSAYCSLCREHGMQHYSPTTRAIVNYILLNLSSDLSPGVIGAATGYSQSCVCHRVKQETGLTVTQFVTAERLRVAKRLLRSSSMSVGSIADYVGIADWNYFTKLFRRAEGCTPTAYRKQHRLR